MYVSLSPEIETAVEERARKHGISPEEFVQETLRQHLGLEASLKEEEDWETLLERVGTPAGVSLTDEMTGSDALYD